MKKYIVFLMAFLLIASVSAATMVRSVPTTAPAGGTFQVSYQASGTSSLWGASVEENILNGCTINGKTSLKFVMMSDLPNPLTYTVQTNSATSCVFSGNFKFGTDPIVNFPSATVTISGVCPPSCSGRVCGMDPICGTLSCGTCSSGKVCSNGQCVTTCPTGQTLCSDGTCKTTCVEPTCSELFSKTLNLISITGTACTDGYIIAGIIGILGMFIISRVLK